MVASCVSLDYPALEVAETLLDPGGLHLEAGDGGEPRLGELVYPSPRLGAAVVHLLLDIYGRRVYDELPALLDKLVTVPSGGDAYADQGRPDADGHVHPQGDDFENGKVPKA